jgi:hypothetical protein
MVERLLLDRVDTEPAGATVGRGHHLIALPGAHEAQAPLALLEMAVARAQIALNAPVIPQVPIASRYSVFDHGQTPALISKAV